MDLNKLSDKEKLEISRKYYIAGFFFLPVLWLVNVVWFFKHAFKRQPSAEQKQMKKYLIHSAIGLIVWTVLLVTWNVVFQTQRVKWGAVGDYLTFIPPRGRA